MTAKMTMKIHVPAYSPVVEGAQEGEYSGVVLEVKKTLDIVIEEFEVIEESESMFILSMIAVVEDDNKVIDSSRGDTKRDKK